MRTMKPILWFVVSSLAITLGSWASDSNDVTSSRHQQNCLNYLRQLFNRTLNASFREDRGLQEIASHLTTLPGHLRRLNDQSHILDFGAGQGVAVAEYLGIGSSAETNAWLANLLPTAERANVTALSYSMDPEREEAYSRRGRGKWRAISTLLAEDKDVTPELLRGPYGDVDLVIDFYGVLAYTPDPSLVLKKLVRSLAPRATLMLRTGPRVFDYMTGFGRSRLRNRSSLYRSTVDELVFPDWLATLPNWRVVEAQSEFLEFEITRGKSDSIPEVWFERWVPANSLPDARVFKTRDSHR
jgi:SAM-dependent methyltransferase